MPETKLTLTAAIGARTWRANLETAQAEAEAFQLAFADVSPIHRAFAPMAREQKFDVSEMAIVTALQAIAYGKPLLILPVTIAARFQQRCLIARKSDLPVTPDKLAGRRIAVRAYTQTTGVWLRGILQNDYGVSPDSVRWVTQEGAHLAEYQDPSWVERAESGRSLADLLKSGDVDAAIFGNDLPDDPDFVPVIAAPQEAANAWYEKHGVVPVNHMMVVRRDVASAHPAAIRELWRVLHRAKPVTSSGGPDMAPMGIAANRASLAMLLQYCEQQKLLPRPMSVDDIFDETIAVLGDALKD